MKKIVLNTVVFLLILSCSSGGNDEPDPPVVESPKKPVAAALSFPSQNSECTEGTNITDTNSTVLFKWNASANTDSYELVLKNLESGVSTTHTAATNEKSIELLRATPYSWYIISKSTEVSETATSTTWKFYNAGAGVVNYAPFPATAVAPANSTNIAATISTTLEWSASDVDDDIATYDVYFAISGETLNELSSGLTNTSLAGVTVSSGTTYEWYVITIDAHGNSSTSEVFEFTVD